MPSVLFILSSANQSLAGKQTGWYLPEAAHPYYTLVRLAPHINIDFAAPKGPNPPIDEKSVKDYTDDDSVKFLNDPVVQEKLATAKKLSEVSAKDYDAVFYVGGHAPVIDLPHDVDNRRLIGEFWTSGKVVSAVCHGPGALVNWRDAEGKSIFAGNTVTGLSNVEEEMIDGVGDVPFSLEDKLVELGATYVKADKPFGEKVAVSGKLITGQNPASSVGVGEEIWKAIH